MPDQGLDDRQCRMEGTMEVIETAGKTEIEVADQGAAMESVNEVEKTPAEAPVKKGRKKVPKKPSKQTIVNRILDEAIAKAVKASKQVPRVMIT